MIVNAGVCVGCDYGRVDAATGGVVGIVLGI